MASEAEVMLQITPPPPSRMSGTARRIISTTPKKFVSKTSRQSSIDAASTGRYARSVAALFTRTRRPRGRVMVRGSVTSRA